MDKDLNEIIDEIKEKRSDYYRLHKHILENRDAWYIQLHFAYTDENEKYPDDEYVLAFMPKKETIKHILDSMPDNVRKVWDTKTIQEKKDIIDNERSLFGQVYSEFRNDEEFLRDQCLDKDNLELRWQRCMFYLDTRLKNHAILGGKNIKYKSSKVVKMKKGK